MLGNSLLPTLELSKPLKQLSRHRHEAAAEVGRWVRSSQTCAPLCAAKYAAVRPAAPAPMTTTAGCLAL